MTANHTEPSEFSDFGQRRKLREQRRQEKWHEFLKITWRFSATIGLTAGLLWIATLPNWFLRSSSQVEIKGTSLLPSESIRRLVTINYPQSIFLVQTKEIGDRLQRSAPVSNAIVERTIFPPKITITVQERQPIAVAAIAGKKGFIDTEGVWIPIQSYPASLVQPQLLVLGANSQNLQNWRDLYSQTSRSPVKIAKIDWRTPNNLILTTELGLVHCGNYNYSKIGKQLEMLDRLRGLAQKFSPNTFTHIDLTNPESPIVDGVISPKSSLLPVKL
jgi:cell division protein FtsQ